MENQLEYFKNNPPRCLDNFNVKSVEIDNIEYDGHGEEMNPFFQLACQCGSSSLSVLGYWWKNPDNGESFFVGPLSTKCLDCKTENDLFDIKYHGYDAELDHGCYSARGEGRPTIFVCPSCNLDIFELLARFEYTGDLFEDDFPETHGREKDLFTWFSLHGKCQNCLAATEICEYECA